MVDHRETHIHATEGKLALPDIAVAMKENHTSLNFRLTLHRRTVFPFQQCLTKTMRRRLPLCATFCPAVLPHLMQWQGNRPFGEISYAVGLTVQTICNMTLANKFKQAGGLKRWYRDKSFPTALLTYTKSPESRGCFLELPYWGSKSKYPLERGLSGKAWQQL